METEDKDDRSEPVIVFTKLPEPGETIVKLRKGKGEPPLIIFHAQFPVSALVYLSLKILQEAQVLHLTSGRIRGDSAQLFGLSR